MDKWFESIKRQCAGGSLTTYEPVDSILWKFDLAEYHHGEAQKLLGSNSSLSVEDGNTPEQRRAHEQALICLEANLIGLAQAIHSVLDLFCQLINTCVLNGNIDETNVNLKNIRAELKKDKKFSKILGAVSKLTSQKEFQYLIGLVNTVKHRRAIRGTRVFNVTTESETLKFEGVFIREFKYKCEHLAKPVNNFLNSDLDKLRNNYGNIGDEVARFLSFH